jgi:hypothetical protein
MLIPLKMLGADWLLTVNEDHSIVDVERAEPVFFRKPHGKRETYTMHRGCMIVRNTQLYTGGLRGIKVRETAVYLFGTSGDTGKLVTSCAAGCDITSIYQAKKLIDRILAQGWFNYGNKKPEELP